MGYLRVTIRDAVLCAEAVICGMTAAAVLPMAAMRVAPFFIRQDRKCPQIVNRSGGIVVSTQIQVSRAIVLSRELSFLC